MDQPLVTAAHHLSIYFLQQSARTERPRCCPFLAKTLFNSIRPLPPPHTTPPLYHPQTPPPSNQI